VDMALIVAVALTVSVTIINRRHTWLDCMRETWDCKPGMLDCMQGM
jgi:hypothetical protein